MSLPKESFKPTLKALSAKYALVSSEVPFVGNASAKLKQGDSVIELNAPHLSFTMEVLYLTSGLKQSFQQKSSNERAAKEKRQADMF
jgi:PKD repeat protein